LFGQDVLLYFMKYEEWKIDPITSTAYVKH
jgi:hypothetical protein